MKKCVWVRSKLLAAIEFLEWTEGDRLRHSKFLALRDDKEASRRCEGIASRPDSKECNLMTKVVSRDRRWLEIFRVLFESKHLNSISGICRIASSGI